MINFDFLNNYADAICVFSKENEVVFKNNLFKSVFSDVKSISRFKNRFNSDMSILSYDGVAESSPIDFLLNSKENFHTICSYQNSAGEFSSYYIYSFDFNGYKIAVFKNVTAQDSLNILNNRYADLKTKYSDLSQNQNKFLKLQENAQTQVLKMGIINRISLVIRETSDIETILLSALEEINNLLGSFKTYFSVKDKTGYKIKYSYPNKQEVGIFFQYENEINEKIKNKEIVLSSCLKEYLSADKIFQRGVNRIVIPVFNKNKFLGIISTLTKQRFSTEDNIEILQSIAVQLASSIMQADLIMQLNKKNNKLEKTLSELKETQLQLINSEKLASLGQLVSGVAHEINTPLASISSNNDLIKKILLSENPLTNDKYTMLKELNDIDIEAASRISNIVKSLKKFVRLDEAEFQKADINKEIDLTLKLIEHETKNSIKIVKNYSQIPEIYCSVNMINQVFMNILINACHSIKENKKDGEIVIKTFVKDNNLVVKIKDNGKGIPSDIQSKVFNTGFTTKKSGMGTGLGLSISKKIIEMHKGNISFVSKAGEGTEFIVEIPYTVAKHTI